jgi:ABC-2 type transport system ATP-binding protein
MRRGAGKTTTIRILTTLTRADADHASVADLDAARQVRQPGFRR